MHRAKGDRFVRASELPVCDNELAQEKVWLGEPVIPIVKRLIITMSIKIPTA